MRTNYLYLLVFVFLLSYPAIGQSKEKNAETAEFTVHGLCGMCKDRIENAAFIKGVKFAEWDKQTDLLKVVYNPQKVKIDDIHSAIAAAGHDTDKVKADDKVYQKLPKCCAYRDSKSKH